MTRGGQVYFLYNRVLSIEQMHERIKALVPDARVGIAHGQMRENALEDVMLDFYAGAYDVLLYCLHRGERSGVPKTPTR